MSKDAFLIEDERILEDFCVGELSVGEAGEILEARGFSPREARELLQEHMTTMIPRGYLGNEGDNHG